MPAFYLLSIWLPIVAAVFPLKRAAFLGKLEDLIDTDHLTWCVGVLKETKN